MKAWTDRRDPFSPGQHIVGPPRARTWTAVAFLLTAYFWYLAWLHPQENFGRYHDDTLYFSSAQALAEGRGYVIPSVPGTPPQTKYPILYPLLLSWVWRAQPAFPSNLAGALWMTAGFGACFLVLVFHSVRKISDLGPWAAFAVTGLTAFEPHFLALSGSVMSDVPFIAFALAAALLADAAYSSSKAVYLAPLAGIFAGLAVLTRSAGLAVIAGIVVAGIYWKSYQRTLIVCLAAAPFVLYAFAASVMPSRLPDHVAPGFRQTWLFYTSYLGYWKLSLAYPGVFGVLCGASAKAFVETPARYCLFPPPWGESQLGAAVGVALSVGILAGIVRQARGRGWHSIHFMLPFFFALIVLWGQPQVDRFLLLFLPLFYAGLWTEGRHLAEVLLQNLRSPRTSSDRVVATGFAVVLAITAVAAVRHYLYGDRPNLKRWSEERASLGRDKAELYEWIRCNVTERERLVAYEDVNLYLHTRRQALRPIVLTAGVSYLEPDKILIPELGRLADVARQIRARYWVVCEDDYVWELRRALINARISEFTASLPVVFRSSTGRVRVYLLDVGGRGTPGPA